MIFTSQSADYYLDNYTIEGIFEILNKCVDHYYPNNKNVKKDVKKNHKDIREFFTSKGA